MVSMKISISFHSAMDFKTKIKLECDGPENVLPFENLTVEALPAETENTNLRLQLTNNVFSEKKQLEALSEPCPVKKAWWQRCFKVGRFHKNSAIVPFQKVTEGQD
jgi:hypothetical protein